MILGIIIGLIVGLFIGFILGWHHKCDELMKWEGRRDG